MKKNKCLKPTAIIRKCKIIHHSELHFRLYSPSFARLSQNSDFNTENQRHRGKNK